METIWKGSDRVMDIDNKEFNKFFADRVVKGVDKTKLMTNEQAQEYINKLQSQIMVGKHIVYCPNCKTGILFDKTISRVGYQFHGEAKDCDNPSVECIHTGWSCEIPLKLPSLNEYTTACRKNAYAGAKMKKQTQEDIMWFVKKLPKFDKPIFIRFHWVEGNHKRDYDNIAFGKKFILDALVAAGKLKDDNRNYVAGFKDTFGYEKGEWKVILEIEETQ